MSILKFCELVSGHKRFTVSVPESLPVSVLPLLNFTSVDVQPFFPASVLFTGGAGSLQIRYVSAIDRISENSFLLHCGNENLPEVYRELIVTIS